MQEEIHIEDARMLILQLRSMIACLTTNINNLKHRRRIMLDKLVIWQKQYDDAKALLSGPCSNIKSY